MSENEGENISPEQVATDQALRKKLEHKLGSGLVTEVEPRAYSSNEVNAIVARLQALAEKDYTTKLITAGFTSKAYNPSDDDDDEQACETCMYYLVHRKFCELPELMLPVEESWSCRLWRI